MTNKLNPTLDLIISNTRESLHSAVHSMDEDLIDPEDVINIINSKLDTLTVLLSENIPQEAAEEDPHELVFRAHAALSGLSALTGEFDNSQMEITGWEMLCLIQPIEEKLKKAEALIRDAGVTPPLIDRAVPFSPPGQKTDRVSADHRAI